MFGNEADVWVGRQYGPYQITELLGRGTVSHVYRAETRDRGEVALKVLTPFAEARAEVRALFEQEYELMARLDHPNVLRALQAGVIAQTHYMEIELIDGETMWDKVQRKGRLTVAESVRIVQQMCSALDHVHAKRIVHRDVKPSNIMLTTEDHGDLDRAILFDFGLSHDLDGPPAPEGRVFGSPLFLAPEQAVAGPVDARTDLYSLGATLYRLTVGAAPFYGDRNELLHAHVKLTPPDPRERGVSPELSDIVLQSMSKDPADRFQTGTDFAAALAGIEIPEHDPAEKKGLLRRLGNRS